MILEIKKLMAASVLKIQVTNAGELVQVVIEADDSVKMTVTGTAEEINGNLVQEVMDRMKEIHEKKSKGMSSRVESIKKEKPEKKKPTDKPQPSAEKAASDSEDDDDDLPEENKEEVIENAPTPETTQKKDDHPTLF